MSRYTAWVRRMSENPSAKKHADCERCLNDSGYVRNNHYCFATGKNVKRDTVKNGVCSYFKPKDGEQE